MMISLFLKFSADIMVINEFKFFLPWKKQKIKLKRCIVVFEGKLEFVSVSL